MKTYFQLLTAALILLVASCGQKDELAAKKEELESKKKEAAALRVSIEELEKNIAEMDPDFARENRKSILITTKEAKLGQFDHFVEVTGSVLSKKNVSISGEVSGRVQEVMAVEGMQVKAGQPLARIDAESIQRNIEEVEKQLELASTIFEKQERLWNQQIGTELQFLEAKNRKETLEKNLAGLKTQESRTVIRAPFSGTVETVLIRLGELVQPGTPMFQFVGDSDLFIEADVSERYIGVVSRGDSVEITFPSINETLRTKVSAVGAIINPNNRTFKVEVFLPRMANVKPNMISVLRIKDYESENAVTVPNYLILQDTRGDYVFVVEDGHSVKRYVERGRTYRDITEIKDGLSGNEVLVDKGFREVGDGFNVNIAQQ
ncbi:putative Co/Zn/Cd efflux system membrane fusion protein [Indibacter alkaliphilus LW1]|uniref:Co/Zn/Cd efflux system membrane fusion protein n=1 Tax=Indibacter alkaliphilus (strain CCUG 57479 / KCTC 22604 / LW1) TaxID=1189612 RepID=S2E0H5_INDAL|nr:efflux RND transporter periplasmic adaptor subunit [Indibacter alkaliphilus]EOZ95543.1 putative Co/Zn/Cd efflux system membrane fusion protein [Indibacter alkaliphilus LW1]